MYYYYYYYYFRMRPPLSGPDALWSMDDGRSKLMTSRLSAHSSKLGELDLVLQ